MTTLLVSFAPNDLRDESTTHAEALSNLALSQGRTEGSDFCSLFVGQSDTGLTVVSDTGRSDGSPPTGIAPFAQSLTGVFLVGLPAFDAGVEASGPGVRGVFPSPHRVRPTVLGIRAPLAQTMPVMGDLSRATRRAGVVLDRPTGDFLVQRVVPMRRDEGQVLDPVVGLDVVDVVDVQAGRDGAVMGHPDVSMLKHPDQSTIDLDSNVCVPRVRADVAPCIPAPSRVAFSTRAREWAALLAILRVCQGLSVRALDSLNKRSAALTWLRPDLVWHANILPQLGIYRN